MPPYKTHTSDGSSLDNDPWISDGILRSLRNSNKKYCAAINKGKDSIEFQNYKEYRNILNRVK